MNQTMWLSLYYLNTTAWFCLLSVPSPSIRLVKCLFQTTQLVNIVSNVNLILCMTSALSSWLVGRKLEFFFNFYEACRNYWKWLNLHTSVSFTIDLLKTSKTVYSVLRSTKILTNYTVLDVLRCHQRLNDCVIEKSLQFELVFCSGT